MIRDAMTRYFRVAVGEEEFDPSNYYVAPQKEFDPKDYKIGENIFRIVHYTKEHADKVEKELGEEVPTAEIAAKVIKGEYDEPMTETKRKEELASDPYEELTEKLWTLFEPLWTEGPKVGDENLMRTFDETVLMNLGKSVFRYMRCPIEECPFSVPRKLSKKEKYVALVKHFIKDHLSQVKGKAKLSVMERFIVEPAEDAVEEARKAFTHPREKGDTELQTGKLMPHQTGAPNLESCSASFEQLTKDKLPKDDSLPSGIVSKKSSSFVKVSTNIFLNPYLPKLCEPRIHSLDISSILPGVPPQTPHFYERAK